MPDEDLLADAGDLDADDPLEVEPDASTQPEPAAARADAPSADRADRSRTRSSSPRRTSSTLDTSDLDVADRRGRLAVRHLGHRPLAERIPRRETDPRHEDGARRDRRARADHRRARLLPAARPAPRRGRGRGEARLPRQLAQLPPRRQPPPRAASCAPPRRRSPSAITEAYAVLRDPRRRQAYDRASRTARRRACSSPTPPAEAGSPRSPGARRPHAARAAVLQARRGRHRAAATGPRPRATSRPRSPSSPTTRSSRSGSRRRSKPRCAAIALQRRSAARFDSLACGARWHPAAVPRAQPRRRTPPWLRSRRSRERTAPDRRVPEDSRRAAIPISRARSAARAARSSWASARPARAAARAAVRGDAALEPRRALRLLDRAPLVPGHRGARTSRRSSISRAAAR